jgi:nuclear pore complex protein Nup107
MCEEKESTEMFRLGGSFWEGGLDAVEKGVRAVSREAEEMEEGEWEKEVIDALESMKSVAVEDG